MSYGEMVEFLRAINHPYDIALWNAWFYFRRLEDWEEGHRPED